MRKIIGFKLKVRFKEALRRLKKAKIDLTPLGGEQGLETLAGRISRALAPAVMFDSFGPGNLDAAQLSPMSGVGYSVILATLGKGIASERTAIETSEPEKLPYWTVLETILLEDCIRFASSLLETEAANEACELGPLNTLTDAGALESVLNQFDGSKIDVTLTEGRLSPPATSAVSLSWLSKLKAKARRKARS